MCLDTVTRRKPDPKARGFGWKVLRSRLNGLWTSDRGFRVNSDGLTRRDWRRTLIFSLLPDRQLYEAGIHIFRTKKAAEEWAALNLASVYKVEWRGLICAGNQDGHGVIVADRFRLVEAKKRRS